MGQSIRAGEHQETDHQGPGLSKPPLQPLKGSGPRGTRFYRGSGARIRASSPWLHIPLGYLADQQFVITNDLCRYSTLFLRQEITLRDHEGPRSPIYTVLSEFSGHIPQYHLAAELERPGFHAASARSRPGRQGMQSGNFRI